jgi:hypothetical protein
LSCITTAQLLVSPSKEDGSIEAWTLSQHPLNFRSTVVTEGVSLRLRQQYRLVDDGEGATRWHVSTVAYDYRLDRSTGGELVSWHWHPAGEPDPHLHVSGAILSRKAHLPSGRVSIESVLRLLLRDLGVSARRDDAFAVLTAAEASFRTHRRWS